MLARCRRWIPLLIALLVVTSAQAAPFAYVADDGAARVTVIDVATNTVVTNITGVGAVPEGVAANPAGTRVYVTNSSTPGTVAVIDTATNSVTATIPVGNSPFGVALNPAGTRAYVGNFASGTVSVLDTATNTVLTSIAVSNAAGVAVNPAGTRVYVTSNGGPMTVIDATTNAVLTTVANAGFLGAVVNPAGTLVYSSNGSAGKVVDTATNTVVATITTPVGSLQGVAINGAGTRVYYSDTNNASVYVVDTTTNTVIATIPVGNVPEGLSLTPDGTRLYVANSGSASVSVIDTATNTVSATIPTGAGSAPFAFGNFIASPPLAGGPGTLQFSTAAYSAGEGSGAATITVTRVGGSTGAVGVTFATSDGTASAGSDYAAASGTLSWADGDASPKTFAVPITDDGLLESNETINMTLSGATGGATLGSPASAVLTILDNDAVAVVSFQAIPTLGTWGLWILTAVLLAVGAWSGRRRRT